MPCALSTPPSLASPCGRRVPLVQRLSPLDDVPSVVPSRLVSSLPPSRASSRVHTSPSSTGTDALFVLDTPCTAVDSSSARRTRLAHISLPLRSGVMSSKGAPFCLDADDTHVGQRPCEAEAPPHRRHGSCDSRERRRRGRWKWSVSATNSLHPQDVRTAPRNNDQPAYLTS
ncbi:hypothetical protein NLJ89_g11620 [Agrocybe chaxingu]|uniref:Uncharacterized protein n=1 Tax=Agrocybe chaxingu TaxID=84603 RepID=A0A9W8MR07_9AGAR|nr:hypothetical protein NLJ89_g11620 [Agrocybe chaxingu]